VMTYQLLTTEAQQSADSARDWLDYAGAFSGLVGALLAAVAIGYAAWQAAQSKRDLIRERRLEFELGLLAEMRRQMSVTQLQHLSGYVGELIVDPADETDIPVLRAALGVKSGPKGTRRRDELANDASGRGDRFSRWLAEAEKEVDAAIQRRIEE
jgi:hypothetical protein